MDQSFSELYQFVANGGPPKNGNRCRSGGRQMICLSVSSVGLAKILNMSNKAGQPSYTSFVDRSKRQNLSVSSSNKLLTTVQRKDKKLIWSCR